MLLLVLLTALLAACGQSGLSAVGAPPQSFEVEWAQLAESGAWGTEQDPAASSHLSVVAPPAGTVTVASFDDAVIPFVIDEDAQVRAYLRVLVQPGATKSVEFGINVANDRLPIPEFGHYVWVESSPVALKAGAFVVTLAPPAAGVRYDLVVVAGEHLSTSALEAFVQTEPAKQGERPGAPGTPASPGASGLPDDAFYKGTRAFPGAEGFGANASGGRGGDLLFVTNLKDSGPGSARAAFEASGKRYIVPLVWGYVDLQSGINVRSGNLTYAGQFMPDGQGLVLRNMRSKVWGGVIQASMYLLGADNAILRYLKVYRGINSAYPEGDGDGVTIYRSKNVILDRAAVAFGNDENINVQSRETSNVTVQHSWILNPLHSSTHPKTIEDGIRHGAGLLVMLARQVSLSHNFFYRTGMRAPLVKGEGVQDIVNNYDYNNGSPMNISAADTPASLQKQAIRANVIGNLREEGPVNVRDPKWFGMRIWQKTPDAAVPSAYLEGNIHPGRENDRDQSVAGQWAGVLQGDYKLPIRLKQRADAPAVRTTSAMEAKDEILSFGGPSYVIRNGVLTDVQDPLMKEAAEAARTGKGASDFITGWGRGKNWDWPAIPAGGISVDSFWQDYFDPWRDAYYPGASWDDYVGGYQVIELFLNSWVPDFVELYGQN